MKNMKKVKNLIGAAILIVVGLTNLNAAEDWGAYPKTNAGKCYYKSLIGFRDTLEQITYVDWETYFKVLVDNGMGISFAIMCAFDNGNNKALKREQVVEAWQDGLAALIRDYVIELGGEGEDIAKIVNSFVKGL